MKRLLAVIMCLALVMTSFVFVSADSDATLTVATVEGPFEAGEEIAIPVTITEWANAYATIELVFEYDDTLLTLDAIEASEDDFQGAMMGANENKFALICNPTSDRQANKLLGGEICVLYFYAATDITESTTVSVSTSVRGYSQGKGDGWLETQTLDVEIITGGIYVEGEVECTHEGEIEIRNETETYTGDTYCLDCGEMIHRGKNAIPGYATVSNATGNQGDQVTVTVSLGEDTAIAAYGATLDYDKSALELVSMQEGDFCSAVNLDKGMATGFKIENVTSGTLFSATFEILAEDGNYNVNVVFDIDNTLNYNVEDVKMNVTPGIITVVCTHEGGEATCCAKAVCDLCGAEYGEYDETNHTGETAIYDYVSATCYQDGYTGDTYCLDCGEMIEEGEIAFATGDHVEADMDYDETHHWYNCETIGCGNLINKALHEGGEATCCAKAECIVCGAEYGEIDVDDHEGETEIRGASETYTGDTYCLGCDTKIADGEEIEVEEPVDPEEPIEGDAVITVGTVKGPFEAGDEIAIPVTITDWANGFATMEFEVSFNEALLQIDAIEPSESDFKGSMGTGNGKKFAWINNIQSEEQQQNNDGGEVCVIYFVALADINETITVKIKTPFVNGYAEGAEDNWTAYTPLTVGTVSGGIEVEGTLPPEGGEDIHECTPSEDIQYDETDHWYNCETVGCGNLVNIAPHEGGEATCCAKAVCAVCGAEYGDTDATNHAGETEVRDASETYTGDTYCLGCDTKIADGETIDAESKDVTLTVATVSGPFKAGDEVAIPVTITEWANGYATMDFDISFDETLLQIDAIEPSKNDFKGSMGTGNGKKFAWINNIQSEEQQQNNDGGEVCVIHFIALADINEAITVEIATAFVNGYSKGDEDNWTEYTPLTVETVSGGIYIECAHEGGEATCCTKAVCTLCSKEYGEFDAENHEGETEIRNESDIYTGDTYCLGCGEMIYKGKEAAIGYVIVSNGIGKQGNQVTVTVSLGEDTALGAYGATLDYDKSALELVGMERGDFCVSVNKNNGMAYGADSKDVTSGTLFTATFKILAEDGDHNVNVVFDKDSTTQADLTPVFINVTPGIITVGCAHEGGEATCCVKAVCALCGEEYGEFATGVHKNTEVKYATTADCGNEGYTGDTYCKDCKVKISSGEIVNVTGEHTGGIATCCAKAVCSVCGAKYGEFDANNHSGGEATCYTKAVCTLCGKEYGEFDSNKHVGETEIRDASKTYTGDTYCLDCGGMIAKGEEIECIHEGGEATCCAKAVCVLCGKGYGEFNATNHAGGTEIRGASETYTGDTYCLGCDTKIADGEEIESVDPDIVFGDVNGDGNVNAMDAMIVSQYYVGLVETVDEKVADVNGDGNVNAMDAMLISQYYVGLIENFPVAE